MKTFRVMVIGALLAGGLASLAPAATASVGGVSKACQSLSKLDRNLESALTNGTSGKVDTGAIKSLSNSFRSAAKTGPKSLRSAMNAIADVAADVSHTSTPLAAAAALKKGGQKIGRALLLWGTYLSKNCVGLSPSTT